MLPLRTSPVRSSRSTVRSQVRQGDLMLVAADAIPHGSIEADPDGERHVLALGESTSHAHVVGSHGADVLESGGARYLSVHRKAALLHEEHDAIALDPGLYRIVIQREYEPQREDGIARAWHRSRD